MNDLERYAISIRANEVSTLLSLALDLVADLPFVDANGDRIRGMDRLDALLHVTAATALGLPERIDALPLPEPEPLAKAKAIPATPEARAAFIAEALGVTSPSRLLAADRAPSPELLAFCRETGASLDFIFLGDIRPMLRGAVYAVKAERVNA